MYSTKPSRMWRNVRLTENGKAILRGRKARRAQKTQGGFGYSGKIEVRHHKIVWWKRFVKWLKKFLNRRED